MTHPQLGKPNIIVYSLQRRYSMIQPLTMDDGFDRHVLLQSRPCAPYLTWMHEALDGLTARMLGWFRRTVVNLSEKAVDDALEDKQDSAIDYEILQDPKHPRNPEMQRRYHQLEAREHSNDGD